MNGIYQDEFNVKRAEAGLKKGLELWWSELKLKKKIKTTKNPTI